MTVYWDVVAIGTDHIYGLVLIGGRLDTKSRPVTSRADTGAEISDIRIVDPFPRQATDFSWHIGLLGATMTSNEQFLILKDYDRIIYSIDVVSGRVVDIPGAISKRVKGYSIFLHPESPDFRVSVLEEMEHQFKIYDYVYDAK